MRKRCAVCPAEFEAKRAAARYCSERCRKRAQRQPGGMRPVANVPSLPALSGGVVAATAAELEAAGRVMSTAGQAALVLARRIDAAEGETGAGLAAMVREHAARMELALAVPGVADPLDELRARRERRFRGAG